MHQCKIKKPALKRLSTTYMETTLSFDFPVIQCKMSAHICGEHCLQTQFLEIGLSYSESVACILGRKYSLLLSID